MCEIYKNMFCSQSCGCCINCDEKEDCDSLCGIYKANKDKVLK